MTFTSNCGILYIELNQGEIMTTATKKNELSVLEMLNAIFNADVSKAKKEGWFEDRDWDEHHYQVEYQYQHEDQTPEFVAEIKAQYDKL